MTVDSSKEHFRLGFLTAVEVPERGYVGGLLVTNHFGRPLEFQCTAPVRPNRTQEILYGPTLVPYLLGDLIGRTLIEKVGIKPHLVLTERNDLLPLRELVSIPVACIEEPPPPSPPPVVKGEKAEPSGDFNAEVEPAATAVETGGTSTESASESRFRLGRQSLRFHSSHEQDETVARTGARLVPGDADLREPFERVREALSETTQSGGVR